MRWLMAAGLLLLALAGSGLVARAEPLPACVTPFSPPDERLKDHALFAFDGWSYLVGIRIELPAQDGRGELNFAYARTQDFCTWENLGPILGTGATSTPDETHVWAPHVIAEDGLYYMFYTGVNRNIAQTIMLATSSNPADPTSWQREGAVFLPNHPGMIYPGPSAWSNARDPMVLRHAGRYYLYYTGLDTTGGIVGVAEADSLFGPWRDLGATAHAPRLKMAESPYVLAHEGGFYLYYNAVGSAGAGTVWRYGATPLGPWSEPVYEPVGIIHDFYFDGTRWLASYVQRRAVHIRQVHWQEGPQYATPRIGYRVWLPAIVQGAGGG